MLTLSLVWMDAMGHRGVPCIVVLLLSSFYANRLPYRMLSVRLRTRLIDLYENTLGSDELWNFYLTNVCLLKAQQT